MGELLGERGTKQANTVHINRGSENGENESQ